MAEDTDILILMLNHWKASMGDMVIAIEKKLKKKASKKLSFWRVSTLIDKKSIEINRSRHPFTSSCLDWL